MKTMMRPPPVRAKEQLAVDPLRKRIAPSLTATPAAAPISALDKSEHGFGAGDEPPELPPMSTRGCARISWFPISFLPSWRSHDTQSDCAEAARLVTGPAP